MFDLEIETGRWRGTPKEQRICKLGSSRIENEIHFLFHCSELNHIREQYKDILSIDVRDHYMHVYIYIYVCVYVMISVCVYICMYINICMYLCYVYSVTSLISLRFYMLF